MLLTQIASKGKSNQIVVALIEASAILTIADRYGDTALFYGKFLNI